MRRAVTCPRGCGSLTFRAIRRGALVVEFEIDPETGEIVTGTEMAEGGGRLTLSCECGATWRTTRPLDLAYYMDGR